MRLQGIKLPSYQKTKGQFTIFFLCKNVDQPFKILRLQTHVSASASHDHKGCVPVLFKQQLPKVLQGTHRQALDDSQTSVMVRLPTLSELDRRVGRLSGKNVDGVDDAGGPEGSDEGDDDNQDCDEEGNQDEEEEEEEADVDKEVVDEDEFEKPVARGKRAAKTALSPEDEPENVVPRRSPSPPSKRSFGPRLRQDCKGWARLELPARSRPPTRSQRST